MFPFILFKKKVILKINYYSKNELTIEKKEHENSISNSHLPN